MADVTTAPSRLRGGSIKSGRQNTKEMAVSLLKAVKDRSGQGRAETEVVSEVQGAACQYIGVRIEDVIP